MAETGEVLAQIVVRRVVKEGLIIFGLHVFDFDRLVPVPGTDAVPRPAELFGFRYDVGLDPVEVNLDRMLLAFRHGCEDLAEVLSQALAPETYEAVRRSARQAAEAPDSFHIDDELWVRVVIDFACANRHQRVGRGHLLRSLTPLYLGRVASFVIETRTMISSEVEDRIEHLCRLFEDEKPYLVSRWNGQGEPEPMQPAPAEAARVEG